MALRDWISHYPGVQALLQQDGDVLPPTAEERAADDDWPFGPGLYILDGHMPVPVEDVTAWSRWWETADRQVACTQVGPVQVSTVFLGVDHRWAGPGAPLLFESMIFGGPLDGESARYTTWEEAEAGHAALCALVGRATALRL